MAIFFMVEIMFVETYLLPFTTHGNSTIPFNLLFGTEKLVTTDNAIISFCFQTESSLTNWEPSVLGGSTGPG